MKATKPTLQELKHNLNLAKKEIALAEKEIAEWTQFKEKCQKKIKALEEKEGK